MSYGGNGWHGSGPHKASRIDGANTLGCYAVVVVLILLLIAFAFHGCSG